MKGNSGCFRRLPLGLLGCIMLKAWPCQPFLCQQQPHVILWQLVCQQSSSPGECQRSTPSLMPWHPQAGFLAAAAVKCFACRNQWLQHAWHSGHIRQ